MMRVCPLKDSTDPLRLKRTQKAAGRRCLAIILAGSLISAVMMVSGCRLPAQTTAGPTVTNPSLTASASDGTSVSENTSVNGSVSVRESESVIDSTSVSDSMSVRESATIGQPTILIQDISAESIDRRLAIEGEVFDIERHSSGNIKMTCADGSGAITVFIPAEIAVDGLSLSTREVYRISGWLQVYRDQLELVPDQADDIIKAASGFDFPAVLVTSVVDGDTLHVLYADGQQEKVRIVGIDSPELARDDQPAEPYAEQAREYLTSLVLDKTVYLEQDNSDLDRYDRQLRYVWLEKPDRITVESIRANLVSSILISQGYAEYVEIGLDNKYETVLRDDEEQARTQRRGLWMD